MPRRLSKTVFLFSALASLTACVRSSGGQGGDEGVVDQPRDGGAGEDAGRVQDAGPEGDSGRSEELDYEPATPLPETLEGGFGGWGCGALRWDGPESAQTWSFCQGPEQGGPWECTCGDEEPATSEHEECGAALHELCGVVPDPPEGPTDHCIAEGADEGTCWRDEAGGWSCRCGDPAADTRLAHVELEDCATAVFQTCAAACEEPLGRCEPVRDGAVSDYTCDCTYYGAVARSFTGGTCHDAIETACNPEAEELTDACNSYAGYCDRTDDAFACRCTDGARRSVAASTQEQDLACGEVLVEACGDGSPAPELTCEAQTEALSGRCVELGGSVYQCRCEDPLFSTLAATAESNGFGVLLPEAEWQATHAGGSCREALAIECPEAIEVDDAARSTACAQQASCDQEVLADACVERISDACAACVLEAAFWGGDCEALDVCGALCTGLVPPPATPEACEALVVSRGTELDEAGQCLCDSCLQPFGECLVDAGCSAILDCAVETGCRGPQCYTDGSCTEVIDTAGGPASTAAALATALGDCNVAAACGTP